MPMRCIPSPITSIRALKPLSAADAFQGLYALQALKRKLAPVIASVDLICVPTAPTHYTVADLEREPIRENSRLGTYTNFVNLLDLCGIAVPTGTLGDGRPASVTLLAAAGADALTATVARELHAASQLHLGATGWALPKVDAPESPADAQGIPLVVVGAHLSGMPLNGQLVAAGAAFDRVWHKLPPNTAFMLWRAKHQPNPDLSRCSRGDGVSIDVEIWRLPPRWVANFVNAIPPPLGIGTISLVDGSSAKGFIAEPITLVVGADDISTYGGWRAFCARSARPLNENTSVILIIRQSLLARAVTGVIIATSLTFVNDSLGLGRRPDSCWISRWRSHGM